MVKNDINFFIRVFDFKIRDNIRGKFKEKEIKVIIWIRKKSINIFNSTIKINA